MGSPGAHFQRHFVSGRRVGRLSFKALLLKPRQGGIQLLLGQMPHISRSWSGGRLTPHPFWGRRNYYLLAARCG